MKGTPGAAGPRLRTYTDSDRVAALASLELNRGNVSKTAREAGIPKPTLILWRDKALRSEGPDHVKSDYGQLLADALREAIGYLRNAMPNMAGRDLAVTTGILADKHLDFTQGRKGGATVNVDNRSVNLSNLSDEQLEALANGLRA